MANSTMFSKSLVAIFLCTGHWPGPHTHSWLHTCFALRKRREHETRGESHLWQLMRARVSLCTCSLGWVWIAWCQRALPKMSWNPPRCRGIGLIRMEMAAASSHKNSILPLGVWNQTRSVSVMRQELKRNRPGSHSQSYHTRTPPYWWPRSSQLERKPASSLVRSLALKEEWFWKIHLWGKLYVLNQSDAS